MARRCVISRGMRIRSRTILLVDMDSFFSSVETVRRPELVGLPVVVGADPKEGAGRGVVSTCSYEAREYGIHSGMPISKAYRLCPDATFLPVAMALYKRVSGRIMRILRSSAYMDKFQRVSIDEAFLDVKANTLKGAIGIARDIKEAIFEKEKLMCSIGIGPNKLVATIASDMEKPDGLTVVAPDCVQEFLDPIPVTKIPGIGKKTEQLLKEMWVMTIYELREHDLRRLVSRFGRWGYRMHALACGVDGGEVEDASTVKSVGREITFDEDTSDPEIICDSVDAPSDRVHKALIKAGYVFRTVSVKVRFEDFDTHTRARSIGFMSSDPDLVKRISKELVGEFIGKKKLRLIGVRLSNLRMAESEMGVGVGIGTRQTLIYEFIR
ncbi:MAG: DNA polymerase IV [Candidatus Methanogaster sp.]|nr:MAG: DNA polymerase IV [ANME-2 cluster archaeon]